MGGGRHRGNKRGRNNNKNKTNRQDRDSPSAPQRLSTEQIVETGNCRFECYYALQGIHNERFDETTGRLVECASDAERETERRQWVDALKTSLPASFRIGKDVPAFYQAQLARELDDFIQRAVSYRPQEDDVRDDARGRSGADFAALEQTSVQTLSFLPYAYQLSLDRVALRKNPALKQLQEWLKMHSAEGHITRQETVSMIPPVLLNVNGNDRVLDMCAAPGSKTSQLLEDMSMTKQQQRRRQGDDSADGTTETVAATGCLIANDSNTHRAYLLSHQLRRILYHHPVALITTCNAQNFPGVLSFDKILCDVPCSGDGTGRKNVDVWQKWANGGALGLHYLQLQIALRGVELLTVGGTMCYSTCSQNPVENEAVVAELLRTYNNNNNTGGGGGGCLELVECRHLLPGFRTRPGRSHWKVLYEPKFEAAPTTRTMENGETTTTTTSTAPPKDGRPIFMPTSWTEEDLLAQAKTVNLHAFTSYDEVPEPYRKKVRSTVFPPTAAEAATMHLERCLRCLPHDNNTGGFFTAILRKIAPMHNNRLDRRCMTEEERATKRQKVEATAAAADAISNGGPAASATAVAAENEKKEDGTAATAEEALPPNEGRASARQKDKLDKDNFVEAPDEIMDSIIEFYGLSNGFDRHLFHYRSLGEKNTLYYVSPQVKAIFELGMQDRITVVNTGLKAFARNAKRTDHVNGDYRICQESIHFLVNHITKRKLTMPLCDFKQCLDGMAEKAMAIDLLSAPTQVKLMGLEPGSFVATIEGYDDQPERKLMACMWRNKAATVNCLVGKIELTGMRQKVDALLEDQKRVG